MFYYGKVKKMGWYINSTTPKTMAQVKALTGCDVIFNGVMYDYTTRKAVCPNKSIASGMGTEKGINVTADWAIFGYGYNGPVLGTEGRIFTMDTSANVDKWDNFMSCVALIKDGKAVTLGYPDALAGVRGRTAFGFRPDGTLVLWCSKDSAGPLSMEGIQAKMAEAGCKDAINLDGGGSCEAITPDWTYTTTRVIYNYICVWLDKGATEEIPQAPNAPVQTTDECPYSMPTSTVRYGSRGNNVYWVQWQLRKHGIKLGAPDGIFGPNTRQAVIDFQKAKGLVQTGIVDVKTRTALASAVESDDSKDQNNTETPSTTPNSNEKTAALNAAKYVAPIRTLSTGSRGDDVKRLQWTLKAIGFSTGIPDGVFGPLTRKAVINAQNKLGLDADGIVGSKTRAALNAELAKVV